MIERWIGGHSERTRGLLVLIVTRIFAVTIFVYLIAKTMTSSSGSSVDSVAFALAAALSFTLQALIITNTTQEIEVRTAKTRFNLMQTIKDLDLASFEACSPSTLLSKLSKATRDQAKLGLELIAMIMEVCYYFALSFLMLILSPLAFAIFLAIMLISSAFTWLLVGPVREATTNLREAEDRLYKALATEVDAAKELRLSKDRTEEFLRHEPLRAIEDTYQARVNANAGSSLVALMAMTMEVGFPAALAFVYPYYGDGSLALVALMVVLAGNFNHKNPMRFMRVVNIGAAGEELSEVMTKMRSLPASPFAPEAESFETLEFRDVCFRYPKVAGVAPFGIGPISCSLRPGRIYFLTGSNGAGKSTMLSLLTGLRAPTSGVIAIDGGAAAPNGIATLITPLFSEPHLFDRLYGYEDVDPASIRGWLARLALEGKTDYHSGRFTRLALSSGQKKRLALICALSEQRPILVCDEWAAEQDPESREWFYRELLPALKAKGRTVVAVSHDDRYFDLADELLVMRDGRVESQAQRVEVVA